MNLTGNLLALAGVFTVGLSVSDLSEAIWMAKAPPLIEGVGSVAAPVLPGEDVFVLWQIRKLTKCPGESSRVWRGQDGFYLVEPAKPTALVSSPDVQFFRIPTSIPESAPPGPLELTIEGAYDCGGIAPIQFAIGPVEIQVAEPEPK